MTKCFWVGPYSLLSEYCIKKKFCSAPSHFFHCPLLFGLRLLTGWLQCVQDKWDAFCWCQCWYRPHPSGFDGKELVLQPALLRPNALSVSLAGPSTLGCHFIHTFWTCSPCLPAPPASWYTSLSSYLSNQRRISGELTKSKWDQILPDLFLELIFSSYSS